ncbi:MFS transporter [Seleniivibrio sp.]|uniref:MFS transporter n=1 Tax=Seleniivibrio sp. TaxID=2898801 RepID=UPI0025DFE6A6|nr:MFS transporter [Seleniivibrio sp.]MCD8554660.1 MFS transporter [Seleniivibrio sp.]
MSDFKLYSKNFVLICVSGFLYFGSFYLLLPTIPQFVQDIGGTTGQIGAVVGFFTLSSVILRPYFGKLADNYGRKKFLLLGSGLFTFLFVFYAHAGGIVPLYILRLFHGVAHGCYLAAAFAYVADIAPVQRRGEVMGVYGVANVFAMALFPAWGSRIITATHDFNYLFTLSAITAALSFLSLVMLDDRRPEKHDGKKGIFEAGLKRPVLVASITFFSASTVYGTVITFLPVYAPKKGMADFGIFFTVYAVFTLISRVAAGKLSDIYGRRKVIIPFLFILAVATFCLPFLSNVYMLAFIGALFGLGFGAFMPALSAYVVDKTEPHERAGALAFFTSFMDVGITTGAIVLGIVGGHFGFEVMYGFAGFILCGGLIFFSVFTKK